MNDFEDLEESAERFAEDTIGVQFIEAADLVEFIGASTTLAQRLGEIGAQQLQLAAADYSLLIGVPDTDTALRWLGQRVAHSSRGAIDALYAISDHAEQVNRVHDSLWSSFREVM